MRKFARNNGNVVQQAMGTAQRVGVRIDFRFVFDHFAAAGKRANPAPLATRPFPNSRPSAVVLS